MNKCLVAYFSCSGKTKKVAESINEIVNGTLYEIKPEVPYTKEDLNWMNKNSRSSVEMNDDNSRPAIIKDLENINDFDTVFLGFPVWWYKAPTIINTFLESYDFSGKTIIPFVTSGSSGYGETNKSLEPSCSGSKLMEGVRFGNPSREDLEKWISSFE